MVTLTQLWLPILVSAVAVFFASFLSWAVLPFHKKEWSPLPDESGFLAAIRTMPPGQYTFPYCKNMKDPAFLEKVKAGPNGTLALWTHRRGMGVCMGGSVVINLVIGTLVAYLATLTLHAGEDHIRVFRVAGTVAIMAYALGDLHNGLWFGKTAGAMVTDLIDGVVFGLVTGAAFAWLWPHGM